MPVTLPIFEGLFNEVHGLADLYIPRFLANDRSNFPDAMISQWVYPFVPGEEHAGRVVVFCRRGDIIMPSFGSLPPDWCMGVWVIGEGGVDVVFDGIRALLPQGASGYMRADRPLNWSNNFNLCTTQNSLGQAQYVLGQIPAPPA